MIHNKFLIRKPVSGTARTKKTDTIFRSYPLYSLRSCASPHSIAPFIIPVTMMRVRIKISSSAACFRYSVKQVRRHSSTSAEGPHPRIIARRLHVFHPRGGESANRIEGRCRFRFRAMQDDRASVFLRACQPNTLYSPETLYGLSMIKNIVFLTVSP